VAEVMSAKLGKPVRVIRDWVNGGFEVADGEVVLLENCRVNKGEKKNVEETAKKIRRSCAICSSWTLSAPPIAPKPQHTASPSLRRSPAPAFC
jgi:hypothetical protein